MPGVLISNDEKAQGNVTRAAPASAAALDGHDGGLPAMMPGRRGPSALTVAITLLGLYVVFGSSFTAVKIALGALPPFLMLGIRFIVAGALLYAWANRGRAPADHRAGLLQWRNAFFIGGSLIFGGIGGVAVSEQFLPSGITALLVSSSPVWTLFLGYAFFHEEITWPTVVGLALGLGGLAMLVRPAGAEQVSVVGVASAVLAGLLWAIGSIFAPRVALPRSPLASAGMQMLAAGFLFFVAALGTGELSRAHWTLEAVLVILYLVIVSSLIGFVGYTWLLSTVPVTVSSTVAYGTPVAAVLIGWGVLGEPMTPGMLLASGVIVVGIALMSFGRKNFGAQPSADTTRRSAGAQGPMALNPARSDWP
jgi:drug/metabolite transporter (DMT)-like permease